MIQLGIDIGGTCVKAAVLKNGRFLRTGQSRFYSLPTADELRRAIFEAAGPLGDVDVVGLCVPGLLDAARQHVTAAINVPGLIGLSLNAIVPEALNLNDVRPTVTCNDATAAAHHIYHSRRPAGRLLVLTLGTGVGNAVLDEGDLLDMGDGASGHLGQIDVTVPGHEQVIGPDGGAGGLEGYLGVAALRKIYGNDVSTAVANFSGDEPAILALARALRIAHAIYRPSHIWLCGGLGCRMRHLLPIIRRHVEDRLTNVARSDWMLQTGEDDFHAARGAALLSSNQLVTERLPLKH